MEAENYMDFRQLSLQISSQTAGSIPTTFGGGPLGSHSHEREFSTVLHAVSGKIDGGKRPKPRVSQPEAGDKQYTRTPDVHHAVSRKADGVRGTKPRDPQAETDDKASTTAPAIHRALPRKADGSMRAEPRVSQSQTADGPSTTVSDVTAPSSKETPFDTDTQSHSTQPKTGDESSTTTSGSDPLLLSLLGAAMVTQAPTVDSPQKSAGTDASTNPGDGLSGMSEPTIQPIAQPAEGMASPVQSETGLSDVAAHKTTAATGDPVAAVSLAMSEQEPQSARIDTVRLVAEKSDFNQPATTFQGQEAESSDSHPGLPIKEQPKEGLPQALVPAGKDADRPAVLVATQPTELTRQNGEGGTAQPDGLLAQQTLEKAEPSLHQKNTQEKSPEILTVAALSNPTQTEGSNAESSGQRKEDSLKWFSRPDVHSAEVVSRMPQQLGAEPLNAGYQPLPYQQGQGGTPSNLQLTPAPTVPPPAQTLRPGLDAETSQVPATHAVQFDMAPAEFGQLRVRVLLSDHTIHTHMSTDRAELGQMLMGQQEQLNTQLSAAGLDLGRFQVQVNQERTNHSGQEWQSQAQGGSSKQQGDPRQQDRSPETPVPSQKRTGLLSLFA